MFDDQLRRIPARAATRWARFLYRRGYLRVDYAPSADDRPRWGYDRPPHAGLYRVLAQRDADYRATLEELLTWAGDLRRIPVTATGPAEPAWRNDWLPGLDAASLYGFLRSRRPARYLEIGSGTSTMVAERARRDGGLQTRITSIDPHPRAEIDRICDRVVREPLELADLTVFDDLGAGDIVFFDGSHRVFPNSDVTVFFLEVMPRLAPGVLVGIHDICLPEDYPHDIRQRVYSEQYMLAAVLLTPEPGFETVLPCWYVTRHPELRTVLDPLWSSPDLRGAPRHGGTFWLETGAREQA